MSGLTGLVAAAGGGWRTSVVRLTSDGFQPTTPTAIRETILPPATLGATVPAIAVAAGLYALVKRR